MLANSIKLTPQKSHPKIKINRTEEYSFHFGELLKWKKILSLVKVIIDTKRSTYVKIKGSTLSLLKEIIDS